MVVQVAGAEAMRSLKQPAVRCAVLSCPTCTAFSGDSHCSHPQDPVAFAVPMDMAYLDCRALLAGKPCNAEHRAWAKLLLGFEAHTRLVPLPELLCSTAATSKQICLALCAAVAPVLERDVLAAANHERLPTDPLVAAVKPPRGPKGKLRRLDPCLRQAIADAAEAGPKAVELLKRSCSSVFKGLVKPRAASGQDHWLLEYLGAIRAMVAHRLQDGFGPRCCVALDASRIGQDKTLLLALYHPGTGTSCWLPPQARIVPPHVPAQYL